MPESYAHLFAKQLLANWLRQRACPVRMFADDDYRLISLAPIRALVSATDPLRGVYEEYPVCYIEGGPTTLHKPWENAVIPPYHELVARHQQPAYILDIAILHMGQVRYGLEVVHRHEVSVSKVAGLLIATHDLPFELYRVNADWVLGQCSPPRTLTMKRLITTERDR